MKKRKHETYLQYLARRSYFLSPTGCRICTIPTTRLGYCLMRYKQGTNGFSQAHRVAWSESNSQPIPSGMHVLHKCDIPNCIEPLHLFLGTHRENMHDKMNKGRGNQPKGPKKPRLGKDAILAIRADTRKSSEIAKEYKLTQRSVANIRLGITWVHIYPDEIRSADLLSSTRVDA